MVRKWSRTGVRAALVAAALVVLPVGAAYAGSPAPGPASGGGVAVPTGAPDPLSGALGDLSGAVAGATPTGTATSGTSGASRSPGTSAPRPGRTAGSGSGSARAVQAGSSAGSSGGAVAADGQAAQGGSGCVTLRPDGSGSGDAVVLGTDLVRQLSASVPGAGDALAGHRSSCRQDGDLHLVATVAQLGAVCLRAQPQDPVGTARLDLTLLGTDVVQALDDAGVPLRDYLHPCRDGASRGSGGSAGDGVPVAAAAPVGAGSESTSLPFTGAEIVPTALAGAGLLLLGAWLLSVGRRSPAPTAAAAGRASSSAGRTPRR